MARGEDPFLLAKWSEMKPDITLVFPSSPFLINEKVFPPLGIMYLSAYLKQNSFSVQCLDMAMHKPEMAESDIIGISFTTPQRGEAYKLAKYYKNQNRFLIAGGPHATHMHPECLSNGFDIFIGREGEERLLDFLRVSIKKEIKAVNCPEIDDYPFPDRDALPIREYKYHINSRAATVLMTSRGCPYHCSFCSKITKGFRMQSAERTVDEILHVNKQYGFEAFMIFDDVFIIDKNRLSIMADLLKDKDFLFRCFGRANLIDDEVCKLLKRLRVVEVGVGIESGSNLILEKNLKGTTRDMNLKAIQRLHEHGIRAKAFLIIGLPGETISTIAETSSWITEARPDDIDISVFQPLPGSAVFANPEEWGIEFNYDGRPQWYKGRPGRYSCNVRTKELSAVQIITYRNLMESTYKNKELLR